MDYSLNRNSKGLQGLKIWMSLSAILQGRGSVARNLLFISVGYIYTPWFIAGGIDISCPNKQKRLWRTSRDSRFNCA